jgi:hypothetical protein
MKRHGLSFGTDIHTKILTAKSANLYGRSVFATKAQKVLAGIWDASGVNSDNICLVQREDEVKTK